MNERNQPYKISIIRSQNSSMEYIENEYSPNNNDEQPQEEETNLNVVEEFKSSVSSFWAFNTDLFDLPPIVFDQEVVSWDKIIRENILQPFLPKNKLIIQRLMKGLQESDQPSSMQFDSAIKRKSNLLAGDSGNADQIEKRLQEVRKKMYKKVKIISPKSPLNIGRKFEVRSIDRVDAILRKQKILKREESKKDIVNRRYYDLNNSLKDLRKDTDFFKLYEQEPEPVEEPKKLRTQRTPKLAEFSSLKVLTPSILNTSQSRIEQPGSAKSTSRKLLRKESLISKKHMRRKSCYCTQCGGLSMFEKHTLDICIVKEPKAVEIPAHHNLGTQLLQPESALLGGGRDKYSRSGPLRRESSYTSLTKLFPKEHLHTEGGDDIKQSLIKSTKNHLESERRKSAFFNIEAISPFKVKQKSRLHNAGTPKSPNNDHHLQVNNPFLLPQPSALLTVNSNHLNPGAAINVLPPTYQSVSDASIDHGTAGENTPKALSKGDVASVLTSEEKETPDSGRPTVNLKPLFINVPKKQKLRKDGLKKSFGQIPLEKSPSSHKLPTLADKKASQKLAKALGLGIKNRQASVTKTEAYEYESMIKEKLNTEAPEFYTAKISGRGHGKTHRRNFTVGSASMLPPQLQVLSPKLLVQKKKQEMLEQIMKKVPLHDVEEISKVYIPKPNKQSLTLTLSLVSHKSQVNSPTLSAKFLASSSRSIFSNSPYLSPRSHYKNSLKSKDLKLSPIALNPTRLISSP